MARRILNRRDLRKQADQAEQGGAVPTAEAAPAAVPTAKKPARVKTKPATPRAKKPRPKKVPPRMRVRWGIFDASVKQVAIFDYNQRTAADEKLAELLARGKGFFYMQPVKEPMPEPMVAGPAA